MTDSYVPTQLPDIGNEASVIQNYQTSQRARTVLSLYPFMADNPTALRAMVDAPIDTQTLIDSSAQMYATQSGDRLKSQMEGMTPAAQRAMYGRLSRSQQAALGSMGYVQPTSDTDQGFIASVVGAIPDPVRGALKVPFQGANAILGPALEPVLHSLNWVGQFPSHLYRTMRVGDDASQWGAALGALLGTTAALALAPITGGGSLLALGVLGGSALLGGTVGSMALSSPSDWYDAYRATANGERTFDLPSLRRAEDILGDPKLVGIARGLAGVDGFSITAFAKDVAAEGENSQLGVIEKYASRVATRGTPQFKAVAESVQALLSHPQFQQAVRTLQLGKISPGRDFADVLGMNPDSGAYRLMSGLADMTFQFVADPTILLGKVNQARMTAKYGIDVMDGLVSKEAIEKVIALPNVRRYHAMVAEAVNAEDSFRFMKMSPEFQGAFQTMLAYSRQEKEAAKAAGKVFTFGVDEMQDFLRGSQGLTQLMRGLGTVERSSNLVLKSITPVGKAMREFGIAARGLSMGLSDARFDQALEELAATNGLDAALDVHLPQLRGHITDRGFLDAPQTYGLSGLSKSAYEAGQALGDSVLGRPLGRLGHIVTSLSTMAPAGSVIHLSGPKSMSDVRAFTELGRYTGMPSWARRAWADIILTSESDAAAVQSVHGFMSDLFRIAGSDLTDDGQRMIEEVLTRSKHAYGLGDEVMMNEHAIKMGLYPNQSAHAIDMPDLQEFYHALKRGTLARFMGIADVAVIDTAVNKIWKPSVLLRIGFIPRAAGEELLRFLLGGGIGGGVQEGVARMIGRSQAYTEAVAVSNAIDAGARAADGSRLALTVAQRSLLEKGDLNLVPAHVRGLVRLLGRTQFNDPVMNLGVRYGTFLREWSQKGLAWQEGLDRTFARIGGVEAEYNAAVRDVATRGTASGILGSPFEAAIGAARDARPAVAVRNPVTGAYYNASNVFTTRLNVSQNLHSIFMGNENNWRHLVLGGVRDVRVQAARAFYAEFQTPIMREISASSATPIENPYDEAQTTRIAVSDRTGKVRNERVAIIRTDRALVSNNDGMYANHMHDNLARVGEDSVFRQGVLPHALYITDGTGFNVTDPDHYEALADLLQPMEHVSSEARLLADEFLDRPDYESFRSTLNMLIGRDQGFAQLKAMLPTDTVPTLDQVIQALAVSYQDSPVLEALLMDMQTLRPGLVALADMPITERAWKAAVLKRNGILSSGEITAARLRDEARMLRQGADQPETTPLFYRTWADARDNMIESTQAALRDINNHPEAQWMVRQLSPDAEGVPVSNLLRDSAQVYVAPTANDIPIDVARLVSVSFDDVASLSGSPEILRAHRETVEAWLRQISAGGTDATLLADPALARALWSLGTPSVDAVPAIKVASDMGDGASEGLTLLHRSEGRNELWVAPQVGIDGRVAPFEFDSDWLRKWATDLTDNSQSVIGRGTAVSRQPRMRVAGTNEDGSPLLEPLVYILRDEGMVAAKPGQTIIGDDKLYTKVDGRYRPITPGDTMYFDGETTLPAGTGVMWEAFGPIVRDAHDDMRGTVRYGKRDAFSLVANDVIPSQEPVRLFRSKPNQISDVTHGLPEFAYGNQIGYRKESAWERFVRFGFDRVIGPSIDAIVRRPMAFHAFSERFAQNMQMSKWLIAEPLLRNVDDIVKYTRQSAAQVRSTEQLDGVAQDVRMIAAHHGDAYAAQWTGPEAFAWMRARSSADLQEMLINTIDQHAASRGLLVDSDTRNAANRLLDVMGQNDVGRLLHPDTSALDFLHIVESALPTGSLANLSNLESDTVRAIISRHPLLRTIQAEEWRQIQALHANIAHVEKAAGQFAAQAAIRDVVPYIDSHEFKSQFAEFGKGFMPFWYAEENFMRRWARALQHQGPQLIRKAQLTYMGLQSAGVVRTDSQGRDYFVYPGSTVLAEAVSKMTPLSLEVSGIAFATPTDQMLPGFNQKFGTPSFNPLVTVSMDIVTAIFPDLAPAQRAMVGDISASRDAIDQIFPAHISNLVKSVTGDEDSNTRYASAMMAALAHEEARGNGIPDNASPGELDAYMDRIREHARIIVVAQGLMGLFAMGSTQATFDETNPLKALLGDDVQDPDQFFAADFYTLVQQLGIEQGTAAYLDRFQDATVRDIVNPMALTVGRTQSRSGAFVPQTQEALDWYDGNAGYIGQFPEAAPWLLPPTAGDSKRVQYAADQVTAMGLRQRKTSEEFLRSMKFKAAAGEYFDMKEAYDEEINAASLAGDRDTVKAITDERDYQLLVWRTAHPIFREELESGDARQRRARTIEQMRTIVADPLAPESPMTPMMRTMMGAWSTYRTQLAILSQDRSADGRAEVDFLKQQLMEWMTDFTTTNPATQSFWLTVLRPESSLD